MLVVPSWAPPVGRDAARPETLADIADDDLRADTATLLSQYPDMDVRSMCDLIVWFRLDAKAAANALQQDVLVRTKHFNIHPDTMFIMLHAHSWKANRLVAVLGDINAAHEFSATDVRAGVLTIARYAPHLLHRPTLLRQLLFSIDGNKYDSKSINIITTHINSTDSYSLAKVPEFDRVKVAQMQELGQAAGYFEEETVYHAFLKRQPSLPGAWELFKAWQKKRTTGWIEGLSPRPRKDPATR